MQKLLFCLHTALSYVKCILKLAVVDGHASGVRNYHRWVEPVWLLADHNA